jgi:hypothetical protein
MQFTIPTESGRLWLFSEGVVPGLGFSPAEALPETRRVAD